MNFVESLNLLGTEAKQISCLILHGEPTSSTEGAVGMIGIDVDSESHDLYKCISANDNTYVWSLIPDANMVAENLLNVTNNIGYLDAGTIIKRG